MKKSRLFSSLCWHNSHQTFPTNSLIHTGKNMATNYYTYSGEEQVVDTTISHVRVEEGVTEIPREVFENFKQLESVILPQGLHTIHNGAFSGCEKLHTVELPSSLRSIGSQAFLGVALTEIYIPDSVRFIGYGAFEEADELKWIRFPRSNCVLEHSICGNCSALVKADLPHDIDLIPFSTFFSCIKLARVPIPSTVKSIESMSFIQCNSLRKINLPEGLEEVEEDAFYENAGLESVAFPVSLRSIEIRAFQDCFSLQKVKFASIDDLTFHRFAITFCPSLYCVEMPSTESNSEKRSEILQSINMATPVFRLAGLREDGRRAILFDTSIHVWPLWITRSSALWRDNVRESTRNSLLFEFFTREITRLPTITFASDKKTKASGYFETKKKVKHNQKPNQT